MKPMLLTLILLGTFSSACDRPECTNTNLIFEQNEPNSQIYKNELAQQLNVVDRNKLRYWLKKYEKQDAVEYLYFNIQGDSLCAEMMLTVNEWERLEGVQQKRGHSYIGAEFTRLEFDIQQDTLQTAFIYQNFGRIID